MNLTLSGHIKGNLVNLQRGLGGLTTKYIFGTFSTFLAGLNSVEVILFAYNTVIMILCDIGDLSYVSLIVYV